MTFYRLDFYFILKSLRHHEVVEEVDIAEVELSYEQLDNSLVNADIRITLLKLCIE